MMNTRPSPTIPTAPILGTPDPKQVLLQRMKDKLAGSSEKELLLQKKREALGTQMAWSRWWRMVGIAMMVGLTWAVYHYRDALANNSRPAPKHIPIIQVDATLGHDEKLLYWTYALYDFDRLKAEYGVSKMSVIDTKTARTNIRELLPRAGKRAAFITRKYQTNTGIIQ